jgi:hypothetical protein
MMRDHFLIWRPSPSATVAGSLQSVRLLFAALGARRRRTPGCILIPTFGGYAC